jgi:hypothetical protein
MLDEAKKRLGIAEPAPAPEVASAAGAKSS